MRRPRRYFVAQNGFLARLCASFLCPWFGATRFNPRGSFKIYASRCRCQILTRTPRNASGSRNETSVWRTQRGGTSPPLGSPMFVSAAISSLRALRSFANDQHKSLLESALRTMGIQTSSCSNASPVCVADENVQPLLPRQILQ